MLAWIAKSRLKQGKKPLIVARFGNLAERNGGFSGFSDNLLAKKNYPQMNKFILVLADALRYDVARDNMGFLDHLVETKQARLYKMTGFD